MFIDHYGILKVINRNTGDAIDLEMNGYSGWFKKNESRGVVYGQIKAKSAKNPEKQDIRIEIKGNWDQELAICDHKLDPNNFATIWRADPEPENWDDVYRFSIFSLQLNKLTPEMKKKLPSTDCRFRPDQRALENGDLDFATTEKHRLEEKQRKAQRDRERTGETYEAKYFKKVVVKHVDSDETYEDFVQIRDYWTDKETQLWPEFPDIY